MRDYRRRRRRNLRYVRVTVGRAELDGLVARGYLKPDVRNDLEAIELAFDDLIVDWLRRGKE
jgi:hypothetical protein